MQTSGVFPSLNAALTRSSRQPAPVKPASRLPNTNQSLARDASSTAIGPQRRRRQLTAQAPQQSNPFGKLGALVGNALRGTK